MKKNELWLIWRIQDQSKSRDVRRRYRVGVLRHDAEEKRWHFKYDYEHDFELARKNGFAFFPGFKNIDRDHEEISEDDKLFPNIASRLPQEDRDDYLDVLNRYKLNADDDEFTILSTTRGRQVTDNYEFVPAFNKEELEFEIAGVTHRNRDELVLAKQQKFLIDGAKVLLQPNPENPYDKNAIKILLPIDGGKQILLGYVPRYYNAEIKNALEDGMEYSAIISNVDLDSEIRDEKIAIKMRLIFKI